MHLERHRRSATNPNSTEMLKGKRADCQDAPRGRRRRRKGDGKAVQVETLSSGGKE